MAAADTQGIIPPAWNPGRPPGGLTVVPKTPSEMPYEHYAMIADQGRVFRKVVEVISAITAALLGTQFLVGGYSPNEALYFPLTVVGPAYLWGMTMCGLALTRMIILIINGYWPHSHRARKWLSVGFVFGAWLPLCACFWWSFQLTVITGNGNLYPGFAYSIFALGAEFLIFYAHTSFVYAAKRG